jgi:phosphatidylcholine synthase
VKTAIEKPARTERQPLVQTWLAWSVHLLTASGAVAGMLAAVAIMEQRWIPCFAWLMVATAIDSFDGRLARLFRVKDVLPRFDGALLDNLVDYFTYVIVPALFIYMYPGMLPEGFEWIGSAIMVLTSAYQFCQADAKTDDHYFKGFPSYWNVVALYLFFLGYEPWVNFAIVAVFSVLVFVPIKYLYPSRTVRFRRLTIALSMVWGASMIALLIRHPHVPIGLVYATLLYIAYYSGMSIFMTASEARRRAIPNTGR